MSWYKFPYPFEESSFDEIYVDNVIEHLDNVVKVMEEINRISKPGGLIVIKVPYFRSKYAFIDPTHKHFFTMDSFTYFNPTHIHHSLYPYSQCLFNTTKIVFNEDFPNTGLNGFLKNLFLRFSNKYPHFYEYHLSNFFPLDELTFYLETKKEDWLHVRKDSLGDDHMKFVQIGMLSVDANGSVAPCCLAYGDMLTIGNMTR